MQFFRTMLPAFVAVLSFSVTGILALNDTELQVFQGIVKLIDATSTVQFSVSQITNDTISADGQVRRYLAAALCGTSS